MISGGMQKLVNLRSQMGSMGHCVGTGNVSPLVGTRGKALDCSILDKYLKIRKLSLRKIM